MPICLVTGASGFIGPRVVARLQRGGREVACLVRRTSRTERLEALGVRLVHGDITDADSLPAALEGIDEVYHLAGRTHAPSLDEFLRVNEQGTTNVAAACAGKTSPPTLVVVSSLAAAGPSPVGIPHTEATPPKPISKYGISKLAGEEAARPFAEDVPTTIVRPPVVLGPGDKDGLLMFKSIRTTRLHLVPQLQGLPLSIIHADDLAEAIALAGDALVTGKSERLTSNRNDSSGTDSYDSTGIYYAADPVATTWAEVGRMAARSLGQRVLVICRRKYPFLIPALVADGIGKITGKPGIFGMDKLKEASCSGWVCRVDKAQQQLGFATEGSLQQRLDETVQWYREQGWL